MQLEVKIVVVLLGEVMVGVGDEGALRVLAMLCFSVQMLLYSCGNFVRIHPVVP